jgi:DNA end-binding protein Ku
MAARAIWKGSIHFGPIRVPVKLYSAVEDRGIHLRLLDARRHEPVVQRMIDPDSDRVVPAGEVRRAVPLDEGRLVVLSAGELEELEPEASREIAVTRFVPSGGIGHPWYDRPYWLGPDGDDGAYAALVAAVERREVEGVARWTMRAKEYAGALRVERGRLALITLRRAGEVVPASALDPPSGRALDERELRMARQLVEAMEGELDLTAFRDEYRERVLELVAAKAEGKVVKFPKPPRRPKEDDLAAVLERSLKAAGGGKRKRAAGGRG